MSTWLSWLLFLPPWLLLALLEPKRKRRFMSGALLAVLLSTVIFQMAVHMDWWRVTGNVFYFTQISAFVYGFLPVAALVVLYWTYPNPWLYFGVNLVIDAMQAYVISPYIFEKAGLYEMRAMSHTGLYVLQITVSIILYAYQMWIEYALTYEEEEAPMERLVRRWSFRARAR